MTVIINLRGTNGSGKSTVVTRIMTLYSHRVPLKIEGTRKRPVGYALTDPSAVRPLFVPGHYETACGGCDTIKTVDQVYHDVRSHCGIHDVLYEGIMVQDDVRRAVELNNDICRLSGNSLTVIRLATPIADCLAAIQARRDARGETKPLNPKNTVDRNKRLGSALHRLRANGVRVEELDREGAYLRCAELLGLRALALHQAMGAASS